jgi:hypothetical protein
MLGMAVAFMAGVAVGSGIMGLLWAGMDRLKPKDAPGLALGGVGSRKNRENLLTNHIPARKV